MLKTLGAETNRHIFYSFPGSTNSQAMISQHNVNDDSPLPAIRHRTTPDDASARMPVASIKDAFQSTLLSQTCGFSAHEKQFTSPLLNVPAANFSSSVHAPTQLSRLSEGPPPSDLFQAGFQDCASEVIRFLEDQERLDGENQLLQGLRCHLMTVSQSMGELGQGQSQGQGHGLPVCPSSPDLTDLSTPLKSSSPVFKESVKEVNYPFDRTVMNSSLSQFSCDLKEVTTISPRRKRSSDSGCFTSPPSSSLSAMLSQDDSLCYTSVKRSRFTVDEEGQIPSLSCLAVQACERKSCSSVPCVHAPSESNLQSLQLLHESQSASSSACQPMSLQSTPSRASEDSIRTFFPLHLSDRSSFTSSITSPFIQAHLPENSFNASQENILNLPSHNLPSTSSSLLSPSSSSAQNIPDMDISTLSPDGLKDVLSSVESCQFHEDPRVRTLASQILSLINEDTDDEEDDDFLDEDHEDAENERSCVDHRAEFEDSGIDLEED